MNWYTTLLFPGGVYPSRLPSLRGVMVYNPVISGWCIPGTGIQFPESAGITSHVNTSQQSIPASTTTMHLHRR